MKKHIYIFRINYLGIRLPIKLSETISILPGNYELSQDEDLNFDISFQINKYSYIFIERDISLEFSDLRKELNLIFALISFLLSNWLDIYPQECYHINYDTNKRMILEKGKIVPFKSFEFNRQYSRILPSKDRIRKIINKMYRIFREDTISDSIYFIIGQFLISKREDILLTKVIYAWNVLEHFVSSYWENSNKTQLYIINEEKFDELIESLNNTLEEYIKNLEQDDIYISQLKVDFYRQDYKKLLENKLRNGLDNFSPIKYKIIRMFEIEGLNMTKIEYEIINKMNKMRNFIFHKGVKKEEIEKEIKKDPADLTKEFLNFLEIKIWQYFKFINKYATLNNELISFKECQIFKTSLGVEDYTEKSEILKKLEFVREKIEKYSNKPVEARIMEVKKEFNIYINFNYKRDSYEDGLVINNLPQDIPSYGNLIKLKAKLDDLNVIFNFNGIFKFGTFSEILIEKFIIE